MLIIMLMLLINLISFSQNSSETIKLSKIELKRYNRMFDYIKFNTDLKISTNDTVNLISFVDVVDKSYTIFFIIKDSVALILYNTFEQTLLLKKETLNKYDFIFVNYVLNSNYLYVPKESISKICLDCQVVYHLKFIKKKYKYLTVFKKNLLGSGYKYAPPTTH